MAVQIILKNSSVEDKRPQASQLTNGEISLNYSSAGAFLCCTDTNGDVQQVGGVKIDETAPDAPVKQTLWFKPSTLTLSVFDGDKWLPIAGGGGGGGTPGGGDIIQIIGNDGIDADTVSGIVTLDVELAGGDDGLEFKSSKLSATLASATDLGSVKVGDNINVTAGKISVPKATSSTFGVVKLGDGIEIDGDGSISIDVPTTTTYRGSCDLNTPPTGQINPDPALKGDAYINSADAPAVDAGWTGITGSAKIGDLVIFDGTTWDLIPLGAGTAPVTSVNGKTGDVVLDYTDVGAASEAQGELADTALQPGDNISELDNDAGYITAAEAPVLSVNGKTGVVVLDAADVGALAPGDNVSLLANDAEYISKGDPVSDLDNDAGYITLADLPDIPDQEPPVIISDTAPTGDDAVEGNLWFNSNDGRTYVYYKDGDSSQWVDASPDSGGAGGTVGDYWLEAGGYLSPKTGTNGVDIGGSKIQLNADGSADFADQKIKLQNSGRIITDAALYINSGSWAYDKFRVHDSSGIRARITENFRLQLGTDLGSVPPSVNINSDGGSSQFAGDMAIGISGSFTPSTPAISLNAADGSGKFAGTLISGGYNPAAFNGFGIRHNVNGQATQINQQISTNNTIEHKAYTLFYGESTNETVSITAGGAITTAGNIRAAGDIQSTSQNGGQLAGFRNQIINGDFRTWQRGNSFSGATLNTYGADRWYATSANTNITRQGVTDLPGFAECLQSDGVINLRQGIELTKQGKNSQFGLGQQFTLSAWTTAADFSLSGLFAEGVGALGTYVEVSKSSVNTLETVGSWTRYSVVFTIDASPDVSNLAFVITCSSVTPGRVTGVQLEPGPVATPFEHRPIQTELALCKRYYNFFEGRTFYGMPMARLNDRCCSQIFWPEMRIAPTVTFEGVWKWRETGKGSPNITNTPALSGYGSKLTGAAICTDVTTINHGNWLEHGKLILDAEL